MAMDHLVDDILALYHLIRRTTHIWECRGLLPLPGARGYPSLHSHLGDRRPAYKIMSGCQNRLP